MKFRLVSAALALFALTAVAEAGTPVAPATIPAVAANGAGSAIQGAVRTRNGRCVWDRRWRDDRRGWDRHPPRHYRERDRDRWRHDRYRHRDRVYIEPRRRGPHN